MSTSISKDQILAAMRRWHKEVGKWPSSADWETTDPHPHWVEFRGEFPTAQTVRNVCGSFPATVKEAGGKPRRENYQKRPGSREQKRLEARRNALQAELAEVEEQLAAREVA